MRTETLLRRYREQTQSLHLIESFARRARAGMVTHLAWAQLHRQGVRKHAAAVTLGAW